MNEISKTPSEDCSSVIATEGASKARVISDKARREAEQFKRRYFDYYDDVKISVKEDW